VLSLNVGALSRRVTRTLVADTSSTLTVDARGTEGGLGVAIDDDPPSRPQAGDSGGIGESAIGAALSFVEVLGRPRGRPIRPPSVVGLNLRPLVSALLDEASTTRLLRRSISERSGRIRPEGRGAPGSATGASTFSISAAVEESRLSLNAINAGVVWTHPRFALVGARLCCRRISAVNEGRRRFKESPQYSRKTDRESSDRGEDTKVHGLSSLPELKAERPSRFPSENRFVHQSAEAVNQ
jgi:hypothetical protein